MVSLKEAQDSLKSKIADSPKKVENCKEKMKDTVQKLRNSRVSALCRVLLSELPSVYTDCSLWWSGEERNAAPR